MTQIYNFVQWHLTLYSAVRIFHSIRNQFNYSKFLNTYLNVIYIRKGLCLSKKMWLSAAQLLTMVLTLLEVFISGNYSLSTTQTTNRMPQSCWNYLASTY